MNSRIDNLDYHPSLIFQIAPQALILALVSAVGFVEVWCALYIWKVHSGGLVGALSLITLMEAVHFPLNHCTGGRWVRGRAWSDLSPEARLRSVRRHLNVAWTALAALSLSINWHDVIIWTASSLWYPSAGAYLGLKVSTGLF